MAIRRCPVCPSKAPDPGLLHEAIRGVGGANSGKLPGGPRRRGWAAPGAGGPIAPRPGYRGVAVPKWYRVEAKLE